MSAESAQQKIKIEIKDWNKIDYDFMAFALLAATMSNDPSTKVGACIVKDKKIVGIGYNEFPNGCEDKFPWARNDNDMRKTKYAYVCHAALNAIVNKNCCDLKGSTIYATLCPCNECAKLIIQSGIVRVVFLTEKGQYDEDISVAKNMYKAAGIPCEILQAIEKILIIDFNK